MKWITIWRLNQKGSCNEEEEVMNQVFCSNKNGFDVVRPDKSPNNHCITAVFIYAIDNLIFMYKHNIVVPMKRIVKVFL